MYSNLTQNVGVIKALVYLGKALEGNNGVNNLSKADKNVIALAKAR